MIDPQRDLQRAQKPAVRVSDAALSGFNVAFLEGLLAKRRSRRMIGCVTAVPDRKNTDQ
jgi:hypothetical protein